MPPFDNVSWREFMIFSVICYDKERFVLAPRKVDIMGQRKSSQGTPRQLAPRIESDPDILGANQ